MLAIIPTMALAKRSGDISTLGGAWRDFLRRRSPRLIAPLILAALALRIAVGDWTWWDLAAAAFSLAVYPFGEWAIHVYLLHLRPFRFRGRKVELLTSKAHREHHEAPDRLGLILLGPYEISGLAFLAVPLVVGTGTLIAWAVTGTVLWGAVVTAALTSYVLVGIYEWTHFLIHTAYRPRSRFYRQIWRTHRLHHFKNERYWHGITNTVADRVLGTWPDHREVPRSATARTLRPE